jgi:hypothetical protein
MDTFDGNDFVPASGQHIQYGSFYCNFCVLQQSDSYKAAECFKNAGDDNREKIAYAYQHYQNARQKQLGSTEMNEELYQSANKFLDVKMNENLSDGYV